MPLPPPPDAAIAAAVQTRAEVAIVRQINRVRRAHHLPRVRVSGGLVRVARAHSIAMLTHDQLSHSSFNGASFSLRLSQAGKRRRYAETLAWLPSGTARARLLVRLWMHSAPHRAVLMDGRLHRVGIGRVFGAMGTQRGHAVTADFSS